MGQKTKVQVIAKLKQDKGEVDIRSKHTRPICSHCGHTSRDNANLRKHMRGRACLKNKTENGIYSCKMCDFQTLVKWNYKVHINKHDGIPYFCGVDGCEYKSFMKMNVHRHNQMKHIREYNTCETCGFTTHVKQYLKIHIKTKHEGKTYPCDTCSKVYNQYGGLKAHIERKHLGIVYVCQRNGCSYKTIVKQGLKEHVIKKHQTTNNDIPNDMTKKN